MSAHWLGFYTGLKLAIFAKRLHRNDAGKQTQRLTKDRTLWSRACPSDSLTATSVIGQTLTVRSVIGHQRCTLSFFFRQRFLVWKSRPRRLMRSSYHDTLQCRGKFASNFNIKSIGQSRFIRKAIDRNQLNDFSISFYSQDRELHCGCSKRPESDWNLWLSGVIIEDTSQENKSQILESGLTKTVQLYQFAVKGEIVQSG